MDNSNYHIIPIKVQTPWLTDDRVFFFQLGKRPRCEALIEKNYKEIVHLAHANGLQFIFHKYLAENTKLIENTIANYNFLNEIGNMDEQKFYDELEWQIFTYQAIDTAYIVRRYNEKYLIAWGDDAFLPFRKGKKGLRFPFESLFPIGDKVIGEFSQLNPFDM